MGYYMGDYYAGDPGFFSFLGKIGRAVVPHIPIIGGPAGAVLGAFGRARKALPAATSAIVRHVPTPIVRGGAVAGRIISRHPVLTAAGAAGALGAISGSMARGAPSAAGVAGAGAPMRGFRRHRRMRVTNPKALRRAIRRAEGFKRLALRVLKFTGPQRHRGRAYFRPRRRKK